MASIFRRLFRRKKQPPLVCALALDDNGSPLMDSPDHVHTNACFIDFEPPALLELFQSQGCASCPPAVPSIQAAANSPNRLLLTYNVTAFDGGDWKDTLARSTWDQRQRAYLRRWQRKSLFTPQVVVNGVADTSGANGAADMDEVVQRAREAVHTAMPFHILLDANDTEIHIDSDAPVPITGYTHVGFDGLGGLVGHEGHQGMAQAPPQPPPPSVMTHDIMVAVYQTDDQTVKIGKGVNKGKKLLHRNVVTSLTKIGEWSGGNVTVSLPSARSAMPGGVEAVAFVQAGAGGPIVAVAKI
ncbi:hypothetical protein CMQ_6329 [Grosmannia clavigera kw1407]|uniref:Uncharacterized protein n=1 Tax=Grosmannia clavigera (strain kw1407 / UAMH 11150) TaxID=655863 RepID=F0XMS6_GROCL|nr:uncharacterized protein CMQ_6329 [Grosmannia clavigera kw1407]EFX01387.1 hypothetical protein CMQ_6329 [Grosmannia clavigera kw1407]